MPLMRAPRVGVLRDELVGEGGFEDAFALARDEDGWQRIYAQRDETYLNLLHVMATSLRYGFDRVQLRKGGYTPMAHSDIEQDQERVRKLTIGVLSGEMPLRISPYAPAAPAAAAVAPQQ